MFTNQRNIYFICQKYQEIMLCLCITQEANLKIVSLLTQHLLFCKCACNDQTMFICDCIYTFHCKSAIETRILHVLCKSSASELHPWGLTPTVHFYFEYRFPYFPVLVLKLFCSPGRPQISNRSHSLSKIVEIKGMHFSSPNKKFR